MLFRKKNNNEITASQLLSESNKAQIENFFKKVLAENKQIRDDFAIFLQGPKETGATVLSYKEKIQHELDKLDLDELYEAWQYSGEDYYGEYYRESEYDERTVKSIVEPYIERAGKYRENKNYSECVKIYQAIIDALLDKEKALQENYLDLSDWFMDEAQAALKFMAETAKEACELKISKLSIEYFCRLFEENCLAIGRGNILEAIKQVVVDKTQAEIALKSIVKIKDKQNHEKEESSLLAYLYFLAGDYDKFEKISVDNLLTNPSLALKLLKYYKSQNRKADILKTAYLVLEKLTERTSSRSWHYIDSDYSKIEIDIRRFLKNIFNSGEEHRETIANLERLFLASVELSDYKELAIAYKHRQEKEKFLEKMEKYFTDGQDIKTMFKVFYIENRKEKILELVRKFKTEYIFPKMVDAISSDYPQECFDAYQTKIKNMLKDADVKIYSQAACHLKRMKNIGMDKKFKDFINWLRSFYSRRYRFIEELDKQKMY